jgi:hypothetical protein
VQISLGEHICLYIQGTSNDWNGVSKVENSRRRGHSDNYGLQCDLKDHNNDFCVHSE